MYSIEVKDTEIGRVVSLSGELSIDRASELKESLLRAFEGCGELLLDLSGVESADIACIQVLCAAHRLGVKKGTKIALSSPASDGFLLSMKNMALYPMNCDPSLDGDCLWKVGCVHE